MRRFNAVGTGATIAISLIACPGLAVDEDGAGSPSYTLIGSAPGDRFGASIAAAGDVDGDGLGDLIVGAPSEAVGGLACGTARVYSGRDGSELHLFAGGSAYQRFGWAVAGGGDLDGDGIDDLVVGAPMGDPPQGSVHAFSGGTGTRLWIRKLGAPGDRFGHSVSILGDLDGDGRSEVLAGAPHADANGKNAGRVVLLSGADGSRLRAFHGEAWDQLGKSVSGVGDVDGDGVDDFLCGAPFADHGAFNSGSALLFSGASGTVLRRFHGGAVGDQLGSSVGGADDVDGDGTPDLVLGIPAADGGGIDSGAVEVRSGATGRLLLEIPGTAEGQYLEEGALLGDEDGDGRVDLLVGAASASGDSPQSGIVRLVSGADGKDLLSLGGRSRNDWFGASVACLGDVDGDGRLDFAAGAPGHDDVLTKRGYVQVFASRSATP